MANRFGKYKPGATRRGQLFFAAALWSGIALVLLWRGLGQLPTGAWQGPILIGGCLAGMAKSYLFLDRAAQRTIERIKGFDDDVCLGAVYSWKTWLVVLGMALMGVVLRKLALPGMLLSFIFFAVGWSLLFSGRRVWMAWFSLRPPSHGQ